MLLLQTITLLDRYKLSVQKVNELILKSGDKESFETLVSPLVKSPEEFAREWRLAGINFSKEELWFKLVNTWFYDLVASKIASILQLSVDEVRNNVTNVQVIIKVLATEMSTHGFDYGTDLTNHIRRFTETRVSNSRKDYKKRFKVRIIDQNIETSLLKLEDDHSIVFTDGEQSLKNVEPAEVRCLLHDIYETNDMYRMNSQVYGETEYSMWGSFVRSYFKHQNKELNAELAPYVKISIREMAAAKFKKMDDLMDAILVDFIMPGITLENLQTFLKTVSTTVKDGEISGAGTAFKHKELLGVSNATGNFGNRMTFSSNNAADKFDRLIRGFIALSKLYRYITLAGKEPYSIKSSVFKYEDPSNKFSSLLELVNFSSNYAEVRAKYDLKQDISQLGNVTAQGKEVASIFINRKPIEVNPLMSTIEKLNSKEIGVGLFETNNEKFDFFLAVDLVAHGMNPLYAIFDKEEVFDPDVIIDENNDVFTELFGDSVGKYTRLDLSKEELEDLIVVSGPPLKAMLSAVAGEKSDINRKMFNAIGKFLTEFQVVLKRHTDRYKFCNISQVELSTFVLRSEIFKPLQQEGIEYYDTEKVALLLLQQFDDTLTYEEVSEFLMYTGESDSFSRLLDIFGYSIFKNIGTIYINAESYLYNLQDVGKKLYLTGDKLFEAINSITIIPNLEELRNRVGDCAKNEEGYFVDEEGNLKFQRTKNNKVGFLHSSGVYVYLDGETEPWGN